MNKGENKKILKNYYTSCFILYINTITRDVIQMYSMILRKHFPWIVFKQKSCYSTMIIMV